jgi:hypothetical protein
MSRLNYIFSVCPFLKIFKYNLYMALADATLNSFTPVNTIMRKGLKNFG